MAFVYRWEDAFGEGPYVAYGMFKDHHRKTGHPTPWQDGCRVPGVVGLGRDVVCGFASLSQERAWFCAADREAMRLRGLKLYRYRVGIGEAFYGGRQCAFKRTEDMLLDRVEIDRQG